jgi:Tfp pilus assembly protein FimV
MVGRSRARYLAPIALTATIVAAYVIVHDGLTTKSHPRPAHALTRPRRVNRKLAGATFYTVQPGDNLSSISVKTGVTVPTLEALNPTVDPNALQTGQRLRLRR